MRSSAVPRARPFVEGGVARARRRLVHAARASANPRAQTAHTQRVHASTQRIPTQPLRRQNNPRLLRVPSGTTKPYAQSSPPPDSKSAQPAIPWPCPGFAIHAADADFHELVVFECPGGFGGNGIGEAGVADEDDGFQAVPESAQMLALLFRESSHARIVAAEARPAERDLSCGGALFRSAC